MTAHDDTAWMDAAACQYADPELFFPEKNVNGREARAICAGCPVLDLCLDYALHMPVGPDGGGIWAGLSAKELGAMRRRMGLDRHARRKDVAA